MWIFLYHHVLLQIWTRICYEIHFKSRFYAIYNADFVNFDRFLHHLEKMGLKNFLIRIWLASRCPLLVTVVKNLLQFSWFVSGKHVLRIMELKFDAWSGKSPSEHQNSEWRKGFDCGRVIFLFVRTVLCIFKVYNNWAILSTLFYRVPHEPDWLRSER